MHVPALLAAACAFVSVAASGQVILLPSFEAERHILHREPVRLPPEIGETGIRGNVVVSVEVDPEGRLRRVQLVSGHPLLVEPALRALRQYRFRPIYLSGRPVAWRGTLRIRVPTPAARQDPREAGVWLAARSGMAPG
ncbi:MAG: energy transducer TonB [Bryobacteraceae bacterium]|nr:energy transducer TonB [Bryobacteraceae bacterium]